MCCTGSICEPRKILPPVFVMENVKGLLLPRTVAILPFVRMITTFLPRQWPCGSP
jgi:hypothetical protein